VFSAVVLILAWCSLGSGLCALW